MAEIPAPGEFLHKLQAQIAAQGDHPLDTGVCRLTGVQVLRASHWNVSSGRYTCQIGVMPGGVFLIRAAGSSSVETLRKFFDCLRIARLESHLEGKAWVMISDWTELEGTTPEGRRYYIEQITAIPHLRGVIYFGVRGLMKITLKLGRALNRIPYPVRICNNLSQAMHIAGLMLESTDDTLVPDEVESPIVRIQGVQDILEVMASIQWEIPGAPQLEAFTAESPWKPVADALLVIKRDLDDVLGEGRARREKLAERNARTNELSRHLRSTLEESEHLKQVLEAESKRNQDLHQEMVDNQKELLFALGEIIETRSRETANHIRRVSEYTYRLAQLMGFSEKEATWLLHAAPMHDAGKIAIPDEVLNKPGKLTTEEFELMKTHSAEGYHLLKGSDRDILRAAATIAYTHHEKWNGTGYPLGLKGEEIPHYGRLVALVDVFDALASDRCYKKAWPLDKVLDLIREERGQHFDPAVVDAFMENLGDFLAIREKWPDA